MQLFDRIFGSGPRIHLTMLSLTVIIFFLRVRFSWTALTPGDGAHLELAVLSALGWFVFALWAASTLGRKIGLTVLNSGPYKYVRHPMYTSEIFFGWLFVGFILNSWLGLVGMVITYYLANHLIRYEEEMMESNFGDSWRRYARMTPRFFPFRFSRRENHSRRSVE